MLISRCQIPPCRNKYVNGCHTRNPGNGPSGTSPKCRLIQTVASCETGDSSSHATVCTTKTPVHVKTRIFTAGVMNPRQSNFTRGVPNVVPISAVYGLALPAVKRTGASGFSSHVQAVCVAAAF